MRNTIIRAGTTASLLYAGVTLIAYSVHHDQHVLMILGAACLGWCVGLNANVK